MDGGTGGGEEAYTVELEVDEEHVTGNQIPIKVNVTNKAEAESIAKISEAPTENFTYTYYIETDGEEREEGPDAKGEHTFTGLDETKTYLIIVKATDGKGNYGETEVAVMSFSINDYDDHCEYYRCTGGMTWSQWCKSNLTHTFKGNTLSIVTLVDWDDTPAVGYDLDDSYHNFVTDMPSSADPESPDSLISDSMEYRPMARHSGGIIAWGSKK